MSPSPRVVLFTRDEPQTTTGGVETFTRLLRQLSPGSEVVAYGGVAGRRWLLDEARDARAARPALLQAIARSNARVIVANGAAAWALDEMPLPIVTVFHGTYAGFGRAIAPIAWRRGVIARSYGAWIEGRAGQRAARVVAVSARVADEARRHYGIRAPITVIENGTDFAELAAPSRPVARAHFGLGDDAAVALFVGRGDATKGFDHVVELARQRPRLEVLVAGVAAPETAAAGTGRSRNRSRWPRNLRPLGALPREQLRIAYAAADVVVHPSRYEGCPFALLEAIACDRPIVATAIGPFSEVGEFAYGCILEHAEELATAVDSVVAERRRFTPRLALGERFGGARFTHEWRALLAGMVVDGQ